MIDPLDTPPTDHGSDRQLYVEIQGSPDGIDPSGTWWDQIMAQPCTGCRANIFAKFLPTLCMANHGMAHEPHLAEGQKWDDLQEARKDPEAWHITFAHDDGCPVLVQAEG